MPDLPQALSGLSLSLTTLQDLFTSFGQKSEFRTYEQLLLNSTASTTHVYSLFVSYFIPYPWL